MAAPKWQKQSGGFQQSRGKSGIGAIAKAVVASVKVAAAHVVMRKLRKQAVEAAPWQQAAIVEAAAKLVTSKVGAKLVMVQW